MKPSRVKWTWIAHWIGGALGTVIQLSAAQGAEASSTAAVKSANGGELSGAAAVILTVYSDGPTVTPEALRVAVAQELGAAVVLGVTEPASPEGRTIVVTYHPSTRELAVSVRRVGRANTTRVVEAPEKPEDVVTVAALLASELARDSGEGTLISTREPANTLPASNSIAAPPPVASVNATKPGTSPPAEKTFAVASFFYPLATNLERPGVNTHLSFNLLYGRIGAIDGLELGLVNTVSGSGRGVELGGLSSWVGGDFDGLQVGGLYNGSANAQGIGLTFGVNHVRGTRLGGQVSGLANVTQGNVRGFSATLGLNWARSVDGIEAAGLANVNRGAFNGLQLAPFNYAGDVTGVQVGVINVARRVRGVQLGLINVADDVEGVPIGVISVTRSGGVHPMFWASTASIANVGIKFATRYTYTFINVSGKEVNDRLRVGPGVGFGGSAPLSTVFFFEPDVGVTHLIGNTDCGAAGAFSAVERRRDETLIRLRGALKYRFVKHFSLFAGVGVVGRVTYPLDREGDTDYRVRSLVEGFGGVEL
jgi:hypothetical protein